MNLSQTCLFSSEMVIDDLAFMDQFQMLQSFEQELAAVLGDDIQYSSSSPENGSPAASLTMVNVTGDDQRPPKQPKIHYNSNSDNNNMTSHFSPEQRQVPVAGKADGDQEPAVAKKAKKGSGRGRPPSHTYDHIMAERKRRELLSRQFLALSAIVPGLRKMDKTSVLGDTIKYLKQIQERVKTLEEELSRRTMESVVFVKKSKVLLVEDDDEEMMSSVAGKGSSGQLPLPEIETRECDNHILIRIFCERQKGVLGKLFAEVDKLKLSVVNSNVARLGTFALDITIVVEKEKEFELPVNNIAKSLRIAIQGVAQTK